MMKKLALILIAFLFNVTAVCAQEWISVEGNAPEKIQERLVSSSEEEIIVDVKVGGFFMEKVMTPKGEQVISAERTWHLCLSQAHLTCHCIRYQ